MARVACGAEIALTPRLTARGYASHELQSWGVACTGPLPAFEGAGGDVAREIVEGESIVDDVRWKRVEQLDGLPRVLVELHTDLQGALDANQESDGEQHLSHGVYMRQKESNIDRDGDEGSPVTTSRDESRSVAHHALDALQSRYAVCVTIQLGIGKTRGSIMHVIQCLLSRQAALFYVGYKSEDMLLFLSKEDSKYRVWSGNPAKFGESRFIRRTVW